MFIQQGSVFQYTESINSVDFLPVGIYNITYDYNKQQLTFHKFAEEFVLPKKIYGLDKNIDTTLNKFNRSKSSVGALFTGQKGSGKTLATKKICNILKLPVILISDIYEKEVYDTLFAQLGNSSCIVLFDEFEKVFPRDEQEKLLTVFDGHYDTKHLFLFTSNTTYASEFLTNRPSRICYNFQYSGIDVPTIKEICNDHLIRKEVQKELEDFAKKFPQANIDLVMALVDELNHTTSGLEEILSYMNVTLEKEVFVFTVYKDNTFVGKGNCVSPWINTSIEYKNEKTNDWEFLLIDSSLIQFEEKKIIYEQDSYKVEFSKESNFYKLGKLF